MASVALLALFARGGLGWVLGFVALVPWLCTLSKRRTFAATLGNAYLMTLAFTAATFTWFGTAVGNYTQMGATTGLVVLLLLAPLFQPQIVIFALVRHAASRRADSALTASASACAWVAAERLIPKLLGDTLGHGLYPSALLRQAADLGGSRPYFLAAVGERRHCGRHWAAQTRLAQHSATLGLGRVGATAAGGLWPDGGACPGQPHNQQQTAAHGHGAIQHRELRAFAPGKGAAAAVREILDNP